MKAITPVTERLKSAEAVLRHISEMVCWKVVVNEPNPESHECKCFSCAARAYFKHNYI